jgi:hypothetical protein
VHILKGGTGEFFLAFRCHAERAVVKHFAAPAVAFDDAVAGWPRGGRINA